MKPLKIEILKRLTSKVLEESCFLLPTPPKKIDDFTTPLSDLITVNINCGDRYGIYVQFDKSLSPDITENMLGMPADEIEPELIDSTLKEMVNIIGGNFMNSTNIPTSARLSIPEIVNGTIEQSHSRPVVDMLTDTIFLDERKIKLTLVEYAA